MLYGIAPAAVAIALAARLSPAMTLGDESPYLFFIPAVLVAGVAGLGPGLFATVLSTVLATFVVRRSHDISAP
jgi:two-component system, LuxR family, sensor kinase FixL